MILQQFLVIPQLQIGNTKMERGRNFVRGDLVIGKKEMKKTIRTSKKGIV